MVEEFEKLNQYTYKNNASLVITRQSEGLWTRESTGDTGESRTLSTYPAQILRSDMGIRAAYGRPVDLIQKGKARKNKKDKDRLESERVMKQHERQRETVLETDVDTSYRPTTKESRLAYEVLMKFAERIFGAQPGNMMRGLCDLLISGCKDNSIPSEREKLKWFHDNNVPSRLFGKEELNELMRIVRGINDYGRSEVDVELDENGAIENVKWEEDEEDMYEIREKEDDGEDSGDDTFVAIEDPDRKEREKQRNEQANQQLVSNMMVDDDDDTDVIGREREQEKEKEKERNKIISNSGVGGINMDRSKRGGISSGDIGGVGVGGTRRGKGEDTDNEKARKMDMDVDEDNDNTNNVSSGSNMPDINLSASKFEISPKEIDAHWLQRKVRQHFKQLDDPLTLSEKLLKALDQSNPRKVEEQLIALVEYQDWEFSKQLLRNKDIIVWCTKRKRAKDAKELQEIDTYMANDPKLCSILEELERTHGTAEARTKQFVHTIHREAKSLKQQFLKQQSNNNNSNVEDDISVGGTTGASATSTSVDKVLTNNKDVSSMPIDSDDVRKGSSLSNVNKMEIDSLNKTASFAYDSNNKSRTDVGGGIVPKDLSDFAQWNKIHNTKNILDLESLAFTQGGHYMSETSWNLHSGSKSIQHKGYLEVIVPALQNKNTYQQQQPLISIKELDEWAQPAFVDDTEDNKNDPSSSFTPLKTLNFIQSQCHNFAMKHSENMLVCAPTGAGKTNIALMCILREIGLRRNVKTGEIDRDAFKCVYIAPMKSLVREIVLKFTEKLTKNYNIRVAEMSGDQMLTQEQLFDTQIIVTTPEKWDVMTRKGMDRTYMSLVKLIIIDEIHLLHDTRGPVLEAIVARTHRHIETSMDHIRLVGLSATLPNYKDVALFLRCETNGVFYFDNGYRPIPLSQRYVGITWKRAYRQYQLMNDLCYDYIMEQMHKKQQVIVFVHSRKETMNTCKYLINKCEENGSLDKVLSDDSGEMEILRTESKNVVDINLGDILVKGFAIHHAGMSRSDRMLIEDLFRARVIKVLVSTSTLAWGVNMPAHAVIIKGTQVYDAEKGKWSELNMLDVLQMFGRAGRPPFDTYGEGILITTHPELKYYMPLLNEQMPIESQLLQKLSDILNAEIVLGTIQHLKEAVDWLSYTYLFVRMCKNPTIYGISNEMLANDKFLLQRRIDLLHSSAIILEKCHMLKYDKNTGYLQSTDMGRVAAHYYISHESIETYNEYLRPTLSDIEILRVFSLSGEFKYISVREGEKDELSKLIDKVPVPIKESIEENASKINVLLQTYIARLKLEGFQLIADISYITQSASRLFRCLFEMVLKRQWAQVTMRTLTFCKMIAHRMWSIENPLRQFNIIRMNQSSSSSGAASACIPNLCIQRLERANMSWEGYLRLKPEEIGELIRMQELGKLVYKYIHAIPKMECKGLVQPITRSVIKVDLSLFADFEWIDEFHNNCQEFWIFVEDVDSEHILHYEYFILKKKFINHEHHISFTIPITHPLPPQYFIRIVSDKWLGSETILPISFRLLILPEKFKPATELLDLQPLPIKSMQLAQPLLQSIFRFEYFNAIQTQVFGNLYRTSENILLCAPINSGKTTCAEIALLKNIMEYPNCKSVYISPIEEICNYRYKEWKIKFGKNRYLNAFLASSEKKEGDEVANKNVDLCNVVLTGGDRTIDLKNIESAKIIITTPEHWDNITRRWRTRPVVQNVSLLICDDLHLIGNGSKGATYEMVVSRMRCMKEELQSPLRMIGLAVPIANASDFGLWLGAPLSHIYNFEPMVRPIPINIHFEVSDLNNFESRHMYFLKPCYLHIIRYCPNKRVIIFCPSARHCRRVAGDICAYAASDTLPYRFLRIHKQDLVNDKFTYNSLSSNKELWECVNRGVGYLTPYMDEKKKRAVTRLFRNDCIQILVVEHSLCWSLDEYDMIEGDEENDAVVGTYQKNPMGMEVKTKIEASMVIIMDTQYYNGSYHEYVDYSLPQIIQMMGKANHRNKIYDATANSNTSSGANSTMAATPPSAVRCVIFCHSSKKAFLNRFLTHAFPVESALEAFIDDHLNAEIAQESISDANDAIDLLTWTYYFRRLTKNPNYYALKGVTDIELSQHLSELVEESLTGLYNAKCIHVDEEMSVEPLNYSLIAVYHYVSCHTIERMHNLITSKSQISELLSIISSAVELEDVCSIRNNEEYAIEKMSKHLPIKISHIHSTSNANPNSNNSAINYFTEVSTKINVLLQTHFIRRPLLGAIRYDRSQILKKIYPIVCALIDMASTKKFLFPTLQSIKLSQMLVQALMHYDSPLLQLPHLESSHVQKLNQQYQIQDIFDITELDGNQAIQILQQIGITQPQQRADIANVINIIPNVGVQSFVLNEHHRVPSGEKLRLMLRIERDDPFSEEEEEEEENNEQQILRKKQQLFNPPPVYAPRFPFQQKSETWYIVVGDPKTNRLFANKRFTIDRLIKDFTFEIEVNKNPGSYQWDIHLMCDSYLGCDQKQTIQFHVLPNNNNDTAAMSVDGDMADSTNTTERQQDQDLDQDGQDQDQEDDDNNKDADMTLID